MAAALPASAATAPSPAAALLTVADWRGAALAGFDQPGTLASRLSSRLAALHRPAGDPAWIHLATPRQLAEQVQVLEARAASAGRAAVLLRDMPLFGVPFAVKDNIDVAGWPTTAACPAFAYVASASAGAVSRLQAAGAVCVGKTNLDQFATGLVGTRSPYGRPASVFAADRVSGGSSSGSAVVVAGGRLPFTLGTDTAGSGRVPAGFNHVVGLKPTPGRVGTSGVLPACRSLDCVSVFALTVGDAAQVLAVIEGVDAADPYSDFVPGPGSWRARRAPASAAAMAVAAAPPAGEPLSHEAAPPRNEVTPPRNDAASPRSELTPPRNEVTRLRNEVTPLRNEVTPLRFGVPALPCFGAADGTPAPGVSGASCAGTVGYAACWQRAVEHLQSLGHHVVPIDFAPLHAIAELLYGGPWVAERHAVVRELLAREPAAFDPAVRSVIEAADGYSATDAFVGQYALRTARQAQAGLWAPPSAAAAAGQVDLLMVPTAPAHPSFAEVDADPLGVNAQLGAYTNFVNLLGWCALALPFGFTALHEDGGAAAPAPLAPQPLLPAPLLPLPPDGPAAALPFGVTFIAPAYHDAALARFGIAWQDSLALSLGATGVPYRRDEPAVWPAVTPTLPLVVVGAHLSGLPLNGQLTERGASFVRATRTAPHYRLYALPGTVPAKPGLQRTARDEGAAIAVEVWELPLAEVGGFLALIPPPLGLGSIELADGSWVHGFICEAHALAGACDVTAFGGWRAYLRSLQAPAVDGHAATASPAAGPAMPPAPAIHLATTRSSA